MTTTPQRDRSAIKAIFFQAIQLPPGEREAYVAEACDANSDMRSEIASLLAAHDDGRPFLDVLPFEGAAPALSDVLESREAVGPKLSKGARVGHYDVFESLGSGGMADVYRAHDTKLDRTVALKFILETVPGRSESVLREARASSALNHPNICTLFETGEFEGQPFLAMEYVPGAALNSLIPSGGFAVTTLLRYGIQIAEALAHAHEHGVIHRDLKAANVVVTPQGRAKVLDFGVAERGSPGTVGAASTTPIQAGRIAGTLSYMAPELLRGCEADVQSDIWALGVLLYELAVGRRPFIGKTSSELAAAIMAGVPPALPARVPANVRAVIVRCLAHDPKGRFERAADVVTSLEACVRDGRHRATRLLTPGVVFGVSVAVAFALIASVWYQRRSAEVRPEVLTPSLAVLPFTVLSGSPEIGFLAIGVPDRIISRISVVRGLRVRAMLDNTQRDDADVGHRLGVDYVLTGTIQQTGREILIAPRLTRVRDGSLAWTSAYTFPLGDLLRVQDGIATGVVEALPVRMTSEDRARVDRQYTKSAEAYELYLRGRALLSKNAPETTLAAVNSFRSALDHDPDYVLAYAGVAVASARMGLFHANEEEVQAWHTQARQAALRALQLGPDLAQSHEAMAAVFRSTEFEWEGTIDESTRALERNPGLDQPHLFRASAFVHLGLLERVASEATAAIDRNPASLDEPLRVQGVAALYDAKPNAAVRLLEEASNNSKNAVEWNLAYAYYNAGQAEKAEQMLRILVKSYSARTRCRAQATLASILAATNRQSQAAELVDVVLGSSCIDHHVAYALGAAYAQLRRTPEAMTWLERATERGFRCYPWFDKDPLLAPLRGTKVFQRFIDELRQSWQTREAQFRAVR